MFAPSSVADERCAQRTDHGSGIRCMNCRVTGEPGRDGIGTFWVDGHLRCVQVAFDKGCLILLDQDSQICADHKRGC
jgi:hypothetical protein